jgi:hypothetical protein
MRVLGQGNLRLRWAPLCVHMPSQKSADSPLRKGFLQGGHRSFISISHTAFLVSIYDILRTLLWSGRGYCKHYYGPSISPPLAESPDQRPSFSSPDPGEGSARRRGIRSFSARVCSIDIFPNTERWRRNRRPLYRHLYAARIFSHVSISFTHGGDALLQGLVSLERWSRISAASFEDPFCSPAPRGPAFPRVGAPRSPLPPPTHLFQEALKVPCKDRALS